MKMFEIGLERKYKKMEANMMKINELYGTTDDGVVTEKRLFDYLLLHPSGYINDSNSKILNSAVAEKYFRMGYITKGVSGEFKQQYRLTTFGLSQIELAMSLSMLC